MPVLRIETNQLLIYDPDASRSTVHTFIARPTPLEERTLGRLFLLVEIAARNPENDRVVQELQEELNRQYYESEDFQIEAAFERTLQKANERLHLLLGPALPEWLEHANILIAVLKDAALHFTVVGQMHAFLVHRQRIVDILETSSGATQGETPSPLKIFTNIISGQLSLEDALLFCTPSMLDYLSQEKLKRIVSEYHPDEAVRQLENLLAESDSATSFGALVMRLTAKPQEEEAVPAEEEATIRDRSGITQPQTSMEELIRREQKTHELLNHPLWPNISKSLKSGFRGALEKLSPQKGDEPERTAPSGTPLREWKAPSGPSPVRTVAKATGKGLLSVLAGMTKGVSAVIRSAMRAMRRRSVSNGLRNAPLSTNRRLATSASWFRTLTPRRRWILLGALILIIFAAQSIVTAGGKHAKKEQQASYQAAITTAREKISAADAALLVKNESGARTLLQEASSQLAAVPANQKSLTSDIATLNNQIQSKLQTIRHVVSVTPELVYDLAGLEVGFATSALAISDGALFTFNDKTSSVYRIHQDDKTSTTLIDAPSLESPFKFFVKGSPSPALIMQQNGSLQQVNSKEKTLSTIAVAYENTDRDIRDAMLYVSRLYTLDAKNSMIFRHEKTDKGYATGKSWLTDRSVSLSDAVALAVDGSVYTLKANGEIAKFVAGKRDTTTFDTPDPILQSPTALYTAADTPMVFVADGANRRVVEYGKDGKFQRQYVADALANVQRLVVVKSTVYVLSGTQIFRFAVSTE